MAAAYFESGFRVKASFELFIRALPKERSYLLAAGLEQALDYLEAVHFEPEHIEYLRAQPVFRHISPAFFEYLSTLRFTGSVWAIQEGTPVFQEEPLLRVTAPIIEAQLVETFLLSTMTFQTSIASKAARVVEAAKGRDVVEFGTRRAHGPGAGTLAARAAYVGGCVGTSNVEAGREYGIPVFGTLAHSFVMAHDDEEQSFRDFQRLFPDHAVLLIDTYDTLAAVDKIIQAGLTPVAVRLDSGDLAELSREVRRRLDRGGLGKTRIFVSSDLDEFVISDLLARGAPVDAFGVGTSLATSRDAPALGGVYKLVDVYAADRPMPRAKLSGDKVTYPGCKQVLRFEDKAGHFKEDHVVVCGEEHPRAKPLLAAVMREGKRLAPSPPLEQVRQRAKQQLARLPESTRRLQAAEPYPVRFSRKLTELLEDFRNRMAEPTEKNS
jgi:nicotinate phosphoribosyltransferase